MNSLAGVATAESKLDESGMFYERLPKSDGSSRLAALRAAGFAGGALSNSISTFCSIAGCKGRLAGINVSLRCFESQACR